MNDATYQAAITRFVLRDVSHFGRFLVSGKDAVALLHHLTTGDIKRLKPNSCGDAVLVSNKARVLDWLSIFRLNEGFFVLSSPNRRELFAPHAQRFVLFRQDVKIEDVSASTAMFGVFGPDTAKVLSSHGEPPIEDGQVRQSHWDGVPVRLARTHRLPFGGYWIWSHEREKLQRLMQQNSTVSVDAETFNVLRVESGLPVTGLELTENINPWEAHLDESISLNKGCYNGQEIIARLNTYQKVKQRLCGLKLETPIDMATGAELTADGRAAGAITSSVLSPRFGPIALAYVRGEWQEPGQRLRVIFNGNEQAATIAALPFGT